MFYLYFRYNAFCLLLNANKLVEEMRASLDKYKLTGKCSRRLNTVLVCHYHTTLFDFSTICWL